MLQKKTLIHSLVHPYEQVYFENVKIIHELKKLKSIEKH